jgi:hypothetical protein
MFTTLDNTIWTESNERKTTSTNDLEISVPISYTLPRPVFCPVCRLAMRDAADTFSWETFLCCYWCDNNFVRQNKNRWIEGWRPEWHIINKLREEKGRLYAGYDFTSLEG